ncbi:hypothetical protein SAMN05443252_10917 [Bacillus sp. OV322]|uniref:hypothetical protein n=1 Tax=Bacillus sp. OV322 TaxID=1882764 RepID=UPI0008E3C40D|nr:hypothetical protein [Bacillus sp. OV322]SFC93759.1 hypothetical protein SAMN05443252_10917 [Bacillus sp. OV322]
MNHDENELLLDWWKMMEEAKPLVRRVMSLMTELRLHPESSHSTGMILLYRAASEVSYGYAGVRGCIRRAFTNEYGETLRVNMARCHSFVHKFSADTKVLLKHVKANTAGAHAQQIIIQLEEVLMENDRFLIEIEEKA